LETTKRTETHETILQLNPKLLAPKLRQEREISTSVMQISYFGIVLLMVVSPVPPEVFIPFAGFMAAQGKLNFFYVVLCAVMGFLLSILPWYIGGRLLGKQGWRKLVDKQPRWLAISPMKLQRANRWFRRYGGQALLVSMLLPGLRNLMAVPAGISGMSAPMFLLYASAGSVVWLSLLTSAGYVLGDRYELISTYFSSTTTIFLLIIGAVAVGILGVRFYLRRKATL
jgi:membrane protein DedA with SNARE-associated domain